MSVAADENRTKQAGAKHRRVVLLTDFQTATCEEWYSNLRKPHATTKRFVASMGLELSSHAPERKGEWAGTRARTHTHTCSLTHIRLKNDSLQSITDVCEKQGQV